MKQTRRTSKTRRTRNMMGPYTSRYMPRWAPGRPDPSLLLSQAKRTDDVRTMARIQEIAHDWNLYRVTDYIDDWMQDRGITQDEMEFFWPKAGKKLRYARRRKIAGTRLVTKKPKPYEFPDRPLMGGPTYGPPPRALERGHTPRRLPRSSKNPQFNYDYALAFAERAGAEFGDVLGERWSKRPFRGIGTSAYPTSAAVRKEYEAWKKYGWHPEVALVMSNLSPAQDQKLFAAYTKGFRQGYGTRHLHRVKNVSIRKANKKSSNNPPTWRASIYREGREYDYKFFGTRAEAINWAMNYKAARASGEFWSYSVSLAGGRGGLMQQKWTGPLPRVKNVSIRKTKKMFKKPGLRGMTYRWSSKFGPGAYFKRKSAATAAAKRERSKNPHMHIYRVQIPPYDMTISAQSKPAALREAHRWCARRYRERTGRPMSEYRLPRGIKITETNPKGYRRTPYQTGTDWRLHSGKKDWYIYNKKTGEVIGGPYETKDQARSEAFALPKGSFVIERERSGNPGYRRRRTNVSRRQHPRRRSARRSYSRR